MRQPINLRPRFIRAGNVVLNVAQVVKIEPSGANAVTVTMTSGEAIVVAIPPAKVLEYMITNDMLIDL